MKRRRPKTGSVLQFELPDGRFAYGRVLRDASVAFYSSRTDSPRQPPLGERDYEFVVGVYDHVLRAADVLVVGDDPSLDDSDEWPPPYRVRDPISGAVSTYHHGAFHEATEEECRDLEPAAAWDRGHLLQRLMRRP